MATSTDDFFRSRLDQMIDLRHPLAVLASRMPWQEIEASLSHRFARAAKAGKQIEDFDLFGPAAVVLSAGGVSKAGRPRLPLRLMVSLLYLKHAFNESDEALVERWGETPTWQYFSGLAYFEHRWPCDPTLLVKFRKLIGEEGVEELLARTIEAAVAMKLIAKKELSQIIVDSTVQEKAITHPTDSKLLQAARAKLVESAQEEGIALKQTYAKESQVLGYRAGRYAHARQYKRMRKVIQRQRTIVGRLQREVGRKMSALALAVQETLGKTLSQAQRLVSQTASRKNQGKQPKLYSWHAPEVECISKVRREVANIIVSPAHKVGDETGRSVDRSLPVHALLATASCEATGTKCRALGPRRIPRGNGVTCEHQCGWGARLSGMVNKSELLKASLCMTSQRC